MLQHSLDYITTKNRITNITDNLKHKLKIKKLFDAELYMLQDDHDEFEDYVKILYYVVLKRSLPIRNFIENHSDMQLAFLSLQYLVYSIIPEYCHWFYENIEIYYNITNSAEY